MSRLGAVVMAAGLGTRMRSELPKVLHRVLGRPLAFWAVDVALAQDCRQVVVVVGHGRDKLEAALRQAYPGAPLGFAVQAEQRGTGHAVMCAMDVLDPEVDEVLVLNGDLPHLRSQSVQRLLQATREIDAPVGILTADLPDPRGYGRIVRDAAGRPQRIVEDKDATPVERGIPEINVGTYVFRAGFLRQAIATLTTDNAQGELYLTDLVASAAQSDRQAAAYKLEDPMEGAGVNNRADLAAAEAVARARRNHALMLAGVTLIDPTTTYVEAGVAIDPDVTLWPGVLLRGRTTIGRGSVVETGCVLTDTEVGRDVQMLAYCHTEEARIGDGARVGPFARLRPGADLGEDSHVGNFVEIKKSKLGKGSKANHLSYLGDATIGEKVNVGAGTITCNYDGRNKFRTIIGDGAFIGSDTQLVAPVTVGAGAYVGAGATVTEDVPPDALAVSRAPQKNIEGYAARKRAQWEKEKKRSGG